MRLGIDLTSPLARLIEWAALPFGFEVELLPPDAKTEGFDLLFRFSPDAFAGDPAAFPGERALALGQDLLLQKRLFRAIGAPTPPFGRVRNPAEWEALARVHGLPARLLTRRGEFVFLGEKREIEELPEGVYVYERAYPYAAEILVLAAKGEGETACAVAERRGRAYVYPYRLEEEVRNRLCRKVEELFLALGHKGGLELRAGLLEGEALFLDFVPYPTARSLFLPEFAPAYLRGALGYALPEFSPGPSAVIPLPLERAREFPFAHPFVLDRPYARVSAPDEGTLSKRLELLEGGPKPPGQGAGEV